MYAVLISIPFRMLQEEEDEEEEEEDEEDEGEEAANIFSVCWNSGALRERSGVAMQGLRTDGLDPIDSLMAGWMSMDTLTNRESDAGGVAVAVAFGAGIGAGAGAATIPNSIRIIIF